MKPKIKTKTFTGGFGSAQSFTRMTLFKLIEIDLDKERERIRTRFNKREQRALNKLCDLFEAGDWQGCLNHVNDKKAFPYNKRGEYPEVEHINPEMSNILDDLGTDSFYTKEDLVKRIAEKLQRDGAA